LKFYIRKERRKVSAQTPGLDFAGRVG